MALVDAQNAGKVIAWLGTALYAAFAIGAQAGTALYGAHGLFAIGLATAVGPMLHGLFSAELLYRIQRSADQNDR